MCQSGCNNENYWGDCELGYCELQIMEEKKVSFLKGDIYYADLNNAIGDVQKGIRPVVVVSNNFYNNFSNCVTVVPISSSMGKVIRTHVVVEGEEYLRDCGLFTNVRVDILDIRGEKFVEIYHNNERIYMNMVKEAYFELKNDDNLSNRLHLSVY